MTRSTLLGVVVFSFLLILPHQSRADFYQAESWGWYGKSNTNYFSGEKEEYITGRFFGTERRTYFVFDDLPVGTAEVRLWLYLPPGGLDSVSGPIELTVNSVTNGIGSPTSPIFFNDLGDGLLGSATVAEADEGSWIGISIPNISSSHLVVGAAVSNADAGVNRYLFGLTPVPLFLPQISVGESGPPPAPVPEPGSLLLVAAVGIAALGISRRKRQGPTASSRPALGE